MAKLKQTTLFGNILQRAEAIYKEPQNKYERFVELWYQRARREEGGKSKQEIFKQAQVAICIDTDKVVSANESYIDHDFWGGGGKKIMSQ